MRKLFSHIDLQDGHIYGGLIVLSIGAGVIYVPAGIIVFGLMLFALGAGYFAPRGGAS